MDHGHRSDEETDAILQNPLGVEQWFTEREASIRARLGQ
jgi:hypothetical protein